MNEQLRELVKDRLSGAVNCPAKDEIIEEITADLAAKYTDLLDCGLEPDAALAKVQEGIGDLSEVVSFINEANRRSEEGKKAAGRPFAELKNLVRQMGKSMKNLEPDLREVANDLKSAAGHLTTAAKGLAQESKEPLKEMASTVKTAIKNFSESIDGNKHRYDYTVPAAEINNIEISTSGGDVTFGVSQDDNIYIVELSKSPLTEDNLASIQNHSDTLTVAQGQKYSAGSVMFNYGMLSSDFEIYLPQRAWNRIKVTTSSGDITLESGLEAASLELETTSGDIDVPNLTAGTVHITTVNGDLEISGNCCNLYPETVNGDLKLKLTAMPKELCIGTVNGDVVLSLPDNDGFSIAYSSVNGDIRSDFELKTSLSDKNGTAVYLEGGDRQYQLTTVNGDLRIYRR